MTHCKGLPRTFLLILGSGLALLSMSSPAMDDTSSPAAGASTRDAVAATDAPSMDTPPSLEGIEDRLVVLSRGTDIEALHRVPPRYPRSALSAGVENWVRLHFDVDEKGKPMNMEVYESGGDTARHRDFEREALRALPGWRFKPATLDGKPVVRENVLQTMTFLIRDGAAMTPHFRSRMIRVSNALSEQDFDEAWEEIGVMKEMRLTYLTEHAYLAMLEAMTWQEQGEEAKALEAAEWSESMFTENAVPEAHQQVLRMAIFLNAKQHNLSTALDHFDTLVEETGGLPEDDPIHEVVRRIEGALAAEAPIVRDGAIEACDKCRDEQHFYYAQLNRGRFLVDVQEGAVERVKISCQPAHVTLAWAENVAWNVGNEADQCWVTVYGEPGSRLRLVELADVGSSAEVIRPDDENSAAN